MIENLFLALQITATGMGLVFAALTLLWWVMALLTSATADREPASQPAENPSIMDHPDEARAAAIAVAVALARKEKASARPLPDPPTAIVSAWQLGMRTRQLYQKGERIKVQSRKIG